MQRGTSLNSGAFSNYISKGSQLISVSVLFFFVLVLYAFKTNPESDYVFCSHKGALICPQLTSFHNIIMSFYDS